MVLKAIKYTRFKNEKNEWSIEGKPINGEFGQWLTLEKINLIVGKNASGKSRTIGAIRQVAELISGELKLNESKPFGFQTSNYHLIFDDNDKKIEYFLDFKDGKVLQERLLIDNIEKLNREKGILYYEKESKNLEFETDDNLLALSRRDTKQQPFFENLYQWGVELNHYQFGSPLGKDMFLRDINSINDDSDINFKTGNEVTKIFKRANEEYPSVFVETIIGDMSNLSYDIDKIEILPFKYFPILAYGISITEKDLSQPTDQTEMSQGMFRALSLLIQLNYSLLKNQSSCILIDDIGEGLDYERSKALVDLIIRKISGSLVQVIMTTNDRYVMNKIPLEYWSVVQRVPQKALFYNYKNSRETFDEFKFTGLNNFDFLSTEFYVTGFEKQVSE